jgi:hypothetical protein
MLQMWTISKKGCGDTNVEGPGRDEDNSEFSDATRIRTIC